MKRLETVMVVLFLFLAAGVRSQKVYRFSLDDALKYAMENNYQIINSEKDVESAKQEVRAQTAEGLPQINGTVTYKDNIARPVFILPGEFSGHPGQDTKVQFGTKYNGSIGGALNQLIFDGRYFVGLKTARKFFEKVDKEFFKNKVAVKEQVANSYYQVLSAEEALYIVDTTLAVTTKLRNETREMFKAGLVEDVDVDQFDLLVANLQASKTFMENQVGIAQAFLKFYLGLGMQDSVILTDDLNSLVLKKEEENLLSEPFNVQNNIDFQALEKQKEISYLQIKLAKAAYMPSLRANLNLQTQAQRNQWDFLDSKTPWDFSGFFGVTMAVPIFSSGKRNADLKKAKIAFSQMEVLEKQTKIQLNLQYQTFKNNYINALTVYNNKKHNRKIAEKIYRKTTEKYRQGIASSLDLLNTHNQFLTAENQYITATIDLLKAAEKLENILIDATNN